MFWEDAGQPPAIEDGCEESLRCFVRMPANHRLLEVDRKRV